MLSVHTHRYYQVRSQKQWSVVDAEIHLVVDEVPPKWAELLSLRFLLVLLYQPVLDTGVTGASQGGC